MTVVVQWSGREARALRLALRMGVRQFAEHLGVADSAVSNWERRGEKAHLRYQTQHDLDTVLARADDQARERFRLAMSPHEPDISASTQDLRVSPTLPGSPPRVTHPVDGKVMVLVATGSFMCGPDNGLVTLPGFYVDLTPTTNAQYARFVAASGHRSPLHWPHGQFLEELAEHPVVYVTHHDATAYARWAGKTLPSEAEWEKAARSEKGYLYPWGNQPTAAKCNVRESGIAATTPVHRYRSGVSPYGVYDLAGNVWEWCRTETTPGRYVLRGSAFTSPFEMAAAAATNDASADMQDDDTGFRCVVAAEILDAQLAEIV